MQRFEGITEQLNRHVNGDDNCIDLTDALPAEMLAKLDKRSVESMTHGNRVAFLPNNDEYKTDDETMRAIGIDPDMADDDPLAKYVQQKPDRYPMLGRLSLYGKVVQLVGGHPSAYDYLRPAGVDEVWAINPRPDWPADQPPDVIVSRDWHYLRGPEEGDGGKAPSFGVEFLRAHPGVPVVLTADIADWFYQRQVNGKFPWPEHLGDREFIELPLQNFFDTEFSDLTGFSIGAGLAAVRHAGAKIVLTGVVCQRSEEEWAAAVARRVKPREKQEQEDKHIAHEVAQWLNRYAGRCAWTHGPTVPGSVAPAWNGSVSLASKRE